jgi:hypothetical protein
MTNKPLAAAALLALAATVASCKADNNVSVQIFSTCALPDGECSFSSTCDAQYIGQLAMDSSVTQFYWAFVEVHNQTLSNEDESVGRGNTKDAYLTDYEVRYEAEGFSIPTARGRILAAPQVVPAEGESVVSVFPIPPEVGASFDPTEIPTATFPVERDDFRLVTAFVTLKGKFSDQTEFETAEYPMPILVCNGCLGVFDCDTTTPVIDAPNTCPPTQGQIPLREECPEPDVLGTTP